MDVIDLTDFIDLVVDGVNITHLTPEARYYALQDNLPF